MLKGIMRDIDGVIQANELSALTLAVSLEDWPRGRDRHKITGGPDWMRRQQSFQIGHVALGLAVHCSIYLGAVTDAHEPASTPEMRGILRAEGPAVPLVYPGEDLVVCYDWSADEATYAFATAFTRRRAFTQAGPDYLRPLDARLGDRKLAAVIANRLCAQ